MKLKQQPDDFEVEELTDVAAGGEGAFALYRLEKRGWTTPDAVAAVRRRWQIDRRRVSYGGLKDRHAHTVQYVTILRGPRRRLTHQGFSLEHLGPVSEPFTSRHIRANRFRITLRDLTEAEAVQVREALNEVRTDGVPNYFDDQRFGSVSDGEFVARLMVQGCYEEALKTALAAPYAYDRAAQKREKAALRAQWGDWPACKSALPRSHARSLVDYLVTHPDDFRGALARIRPELRGLYLSAYQSYLWNRMLRAWLVENLGPAQLGTVRLRLGEAPVYRSLDACRRAELARLCLPLPSARAGPQDPGRALMERVLAEEGVTTDQLRLKGFRDLFFSKGERSAHCLPVGLGAEQAADERHANRVKLTLAFDLLRGCYATLVVKRLTATRFPSRPPQSG
jgi:tRNA pseudouridine13 synthase